MLGFSSIIGQMTDDERFISKFSADPRNVLIEYISFRNFRCRYWGILDGSILGQETSQKRGAFNSSGLSRSENKRKSKKTDREEDRGNFYKIVIRNGEIRSSGIRSCSFIFYSVAITPDSKSRQSCARQLRDPRTFP